MESSLQQATCCNSSLASVVCPKSILANILEFPVHGLPLRPLWNYRIDFLVLSSTRVTSKPPKRAKIRAPDTATG